MNRVDRLEQIISRLSHGEYLGTPMMMEQFGATKKIILNDMNHYILPYFSEKIHYDYTLKKYRADYNFLSTTLLSAKELAILCVLQNKAGDKYSDKGFDDLTHTLFEKLENALEDGLYKSGAIEQIDEFKAEIIAIKNSIDRRVKIRCIYNNKEREIEPISILNLEGFWYLALIEEGRVKTFHLNSIKDIEILHENSNIDTTLLEKFDKAINAYYKVQNTPIEIELFLDKEVAKYFQRLPISKSQRVMREYEDGSVDIALEVSDFMEIIPTIQRYAPHIGVISPEELRERVRENFIKYIEVFG